MAEIEWGQTSGKKVWQPPSVPFLWEVRPGMPKKDWKPEVTSPTPVSTPPLKLIASVPFQWEEKPGTPLPSFSQPPKESLTALFPFPPTYGYSSKDYEVDENDKDYSSSDNNDGEYDNRSLFKMDLETFGSETDESYHSPSVLANCLVSAATSAAGPARNTYLTEDNNSDMLDSPSSLASETDSSTGSYATGHSSLVGASFLECLFPLIPPNSGFLGKVGQPEEFEAPQEVWNQKFDHQNNDSQMIRRPQTLGELIMMSRRRSYRRKAVQMRKQNLSMEFTKGGAFGCCIFGYGNKMIEEMGIKRKQLPRLKLAW
ncbi:hypothetical protein G4B88_008003 [Cannabis sativa]|uniref:Hydroxyproline-rich glycoprotein family protein n=1 Tax=Cannabis sativa TaxID=3483 RepID=A0A7J6I723_CANSA|nr:hypothetical protein G4B88_008003 [Cannabis sativa]